MNTNSIYIRNANDKDAPLLRKLASLCPPLDIHTHYTYWFMCRFSDDNCFIAFERETPIGYITSVDTNQGVFIWQIGLILEKQGLGYSVLLIDKVVNHALSQNKRMIVTISRDNENSYQAFKKYCEKHSLSMTPCDELEITDIDDPDFCEKEVIYIISTE